MQRFIIASPPNGYGNFLNRKHTNLVRCPPMPRGTPHLCSAPSSPWSAVASFSALTPPPPTHHNNTQNHTRAAWAPAVTSMGTSCYQHVKAGAWPCLYCWEWKSSTMDRCIIVTRILHPRSLQFCAIVAPWIIFKCMSDHNTSYWRQRVPSPHNSLPTKGKLLQVNRNPKMKRKVP